MADPIVHITNGVPDSGTGNITTLGQVLAAFQSTAFAKIKSVAGAPAAVAVKAGAGSLKGVSVFCNNASIPIFMKFYDLAAASVVVGTTVPVFTIGVSPGAQRDFVPSTGAAFATAIAYAITGGIAENDTTAVAVDDLVGLLTYA